MVSSPQVGNGRLTDRATKPALGDQSIGQTKKSMQPIVLQPFPRYRAQVGSNLEVTTNMLIVLLLQAVSIGSRNLLLWPTILSNISRT